MITVSIEKARQKSTNTIIYQYELNDFMHRKLKQDFECVECSNPLSVHKKNDLFYFQHPKDSCVTHRNNPELIALNLDYQRSNRHNLYQEAIIEFLYNEKCMSIQKEKTFYIDGKAKHRADIYFELLDKIFEITYEISSDYDYIYIDIFTYKG